MVTNNKMVTNLPLHNAHPCTNLRVFSETFDLFKAFVYIWMRLRSAIKVKKMRTFHRCAIFTRKPSKKRTISHIETNLSSRNRDISLKI